MLSVRRWPLVLALFIVGCGSSPTPTAQRPPSALDRARTTGTAAAVVREATERACRGRANAGPKNCATATALAAYGAADKTAAAGGCSGRLDCRGTTEAILTATPPATK